MATEINTQRKKLVESAQAQRNATGSFMSTVEGGCHAFANSHRHHKQSNEAFN